VGLDKRSSVKLEAINALAQLIAAIGVIVSLFYLAAQIRQNTRSMRAVVVDSLAHSLVDLLGPHAQNPESLRAFSVVTENWNAASEQDRARTLPFIFATFKLFRECVVPATPGHAGSPAMGRLGCVYSHLLSPAWRKDVVVGATCRFCTRFPQLFLDQSTGKGPATDQRGDPRWISVSRRRLQLNTPTAEFRRET